MPQIPGAQPPMVPPGQPVPGGPSPASGGRPGAGGPSSGGMNPILILLSFLAGAGMDKVVQNLMKMMKPPGSGEARAHRGGVRMEAAQNPGMTLAPQALQQMQSGGGPNGGDPKLQMLIQQLLSGGGNTTS